MKFQKRTPEIATPEHMRDVPRETPWGTMTYLDYRRRVEFGERRVRRDRDVRAARGLDWFASPWDVPSVEFLEGLDVVAHKVASASLTDLELLDGAARHRQARDPLDRHVDASRRSTARSRCSAPTGSCSCTRPRRYPMPPEEANLRMIATLRERYPGVPIGYSGHERGLQISLAAVALGAVAVERHITLDRAMWGSDQAASLEPQGSAPRARHPRHRARRMGDGVKRVFPGEEAPMAKLRRVPA